MRRIAPALALFLVAPWVAEFLLGNLPITMLGALVVLAPMYGGGALLIRELVRRSRRPFPSIVLLGLAYGIFEEAFTTQSLFNPNYLKANLHLLDHAYIPSLGIGAWWTLFVLTLHMVWSISTSIALVEAFVPARRTEPWLGMPGLAVTGVLFALGAVATTAFTMRMDRFVASPLQFAAAAAAIVVLTIVAFRLPGAAARAGSARPSAPSPWAVGAGALAAASLFLLVPPAWNWGAVAVYVLLGGATIAAILRWSSGGDWNDAHRLALAGGAALAYAWHAFPQPSLGGDPRLDLIGNTVFAAMAVAIIAIAAWRLRRTWDSPAL